MNYLTLAISFLSDFVITAGGTLATAMVHAGNTETPSQAVLLLSLVLGLVAASRRVQALIAPSATAPQLK